MKYGNNFNYEQLIDCAKGLLFGKGNAQLPHPPMLMFDKIIEINRDGGLFKKGEILAELNLKPESAFKKSARIVGDVMGKYHPHGDAAIYQSMVRMAQDFSMRLELIDGQGNFGSLDGDPPAAMR